jgi:hypothetical protein
LLCLNIYYLNTEVDTEREKNEKENFKNKKDQENEKKQKEISVLLQ